MGGHLCSPYFQEEGSHQSCEHVVTRGGARGESRVPPFFNCTRSVQRFRNPESCHELTVCLCSHWSFSRAELASPSGDVLHPAVTGSPAAETRSALPTREEIRLRIPQPNLRTKQEKETEEARRRDEEKIELTR